MDSSNSPADEVKVKHRLHRTLLHAPHNGLGGVGEEFAIQVHFRSIAALLMVICGNSSVALICRDRW